MQMFMLYYRGDYKSIIIKDRQKPLVFHIVISTTLNQ